MIWAERLLTELDELAVAALAIVQECGQADGRVGSIGGRPAAGAEPAGDPAKEGRPCAQGRVRGLGWLCRPAPSGRVPQRRPGGARRRGWAKGATEIEIEAGELWAQCRAGDAVARHALIERYLPLCRRIAYATGVLPTAALGSEDLEAAGAIGLIQA